MLFRSTLRNTLDFVREQDVRDREDKILLHRPRNVEQQSEPGESDKESRKAI